MVAAMDEYWKDHPPVHLMVAAYLGIGKKSQAAANQEIDSASEFVPVTSLPSAEFNDVLASFGLPISPAPLVSAVSNQPAT